MAFEHIKRVLANPHIIVPFMQKKKKNPLKLYISIANESIGCLLAQDVKDGSERAIYYLSWLLNDVEIRCTPIEKLCLSLYYKYTKVEYYMLLKEVSITCKINIVRYLLNRPILKGRLMRWAIKLHAFALNYVSLRAVKG